MTLEPLGAASPTIQVHAVAALMALVIGAVQLVGPKGRLRHRVLGYTWVALMMLIAISSFGIHDIKQWRGFSFIHLLSVLALVSVPLAVLAVRRGNVRHHRIAMTGIYWFALILAGAFTLLPGRIMHQVLFG